MAHSIYSVYGRRLLILLEDFLIPNALDPQWTHRQLSAKRIVSEDIELVLSLSLLLLLFKSELSIGKGNIFDICCFEYTRELKQFLPLNASLANSRQNKHIPYRNANNFHWPEKKTQYVWYCFLRSPLHFRLFWLRFCSR